MGAQPPSIPYILGEGVNYLTLMSATRGETLTPNPNECNSTLTSVTGGTCPHPDTYINKCSLVVWNLGSPGSLGPEWQAKRYSQLVARRSQPRSEVTRRLDSASCKNFEKLRFVASHESIIRRVWHILKKTERRLQFSFEVNN